ncbi:MAG TPA: hypothetical protein VM597_27300, partial [Gemmataceae bacterium]|nr:hypothetical protein [Gemmataceae bacterium]
RRSRTDRFVVNFDDRPLNLNDLLQFRPNGTVQGGATWEGPPFSMSRYFRDAHDPKRGTYVLNTFMTPPGLQFSLTDSRGTIDCRGRLEGEVLRIERFIRANGQEDRLKYTLVRIDGVDSFDSPTVAVSPAPT